MKRNPVNQALFALILSAAYVLPAVAEPQAESAEQPLSSEAREVSSPAEDAIYRLKQAHAKQRSERVAEPVDKDQPSLLGSAKSVGYFFIFLLAGISLLKRFQKGSTGSVSSEAINICARKQVASRSALLIVEAGGQRLLLAQNGDELSLVTELHEPVVRNEASLALFDAEEANNAPRAAVG